MKVGYNLPCDFSDPGTKRLRRRRKLVAATGGGASLHHPVATPDFTAVRSRVDQFPSVNVAVMVGDRNGALLRYERGTMATTRPMFIASASKLLLGATAWLMVVDRRIAALAMTAREGKSVDAIMRERLLDQLGVSAETRYTLGADNNPTNSGGMRSTGEDYARVLSAILRSDIIEDRSGSIAGRVAARPVATVPPAISDNGLVWRYGWGFWKECDGNAYVPSCNAAPVISSEGALGFTPWIDVDKGYWAILIIEEPLKHGFDPAQRAIALKQELQPLIVAALRR